MSSEFRILIVDDEPAMLHGASRLIESMGYESSTCSNGFDAIEVLNTEKFDLVISDLLMPDMDGVELLRKVIEIKPDLPVVIFSAYGTIDRAVSAMRAGAFDFLEKPIEVDRLQIVIEKCRQQQELIREKQNLLNQLEQRFSFDNIVGRSAGMQEIFRLIENISDVNANILITGESGTGKELIARSIHAHSPRKTKPFVPVNCSAFPENLFEAELFGYEKGAFTGANQRKIGLLEYAHQGTFFLDEVSEMPINLQAKLLRVLQDQQLRRLGGNELIQVDLRLISATNRDPADALANGHMREDFYYRLNVVNVHIPPLRDRREDIPLLIHHFLDNLLKTSAKSIKGIEQSTMDQLVAYDWPGNVRELENIIERAIALCQTECINIRDLPPQFKIESLTPGPNFEQITLVDAKQNAIDATEKAYLEYLLNKLDGNVTRVADASGMTRRNIHRLLKRHALNPEEWRQSKNM